MKQLPYMLLSIVALASCASIPPEAYSNRGNPEALLDVSAEVVNLDISTPATVSELEGWVREDAPSRAELYCAAGSELCTKAQAVLARYGIAFEVVPSAEDSAALIYERILARDCENRYIDHSINPYHLSAPTFGCSVSVNIVQHVTDKQQFIRPSLLETQDAAKAIQAHQNYMKPAVIEPLTGVAEGLTDSASSD